MIETEQKVVVEATAKTNVFPLSHAQSGIWFASELNPGTEAYHQHIVLRLKGKLYPDVLIASIKMVLERHSILRSTFVVIDGQPMQVVGEEACLAINVGSVREIPESKRTEHLQDLLKEEVGRAFDFVNGPVIRFNLIEVDEDRHILLIVAHHIACDWWSLRVFLDDLNGFYSALIGDASSVRVPLSIQYPEYAQQEWETITPTSHREELKYWIRKLDDVEIIQLGNRESVDGSRTFDAGWQDSVLPQELVQRMMRSSREQRTTLSNFMLAAFLVVLHKYSSQTDLAVGVAVGGRNSVELEHLIGVFLNIVVVRSRLKATHTLREIVKLVTKEAFEAYAHNSVPFEWIIQSLPQTLHTRGQLQKLQLCNVSWAFHGGLAEVASGSSLADLEMAVVHDLTQISTIVDLECQVWQSSRELRVRIAYSSELFDRETVESLLQHLYAVLDQMVESPDGLLSEVRLLGVDEESQVLREWNATSAEYRSDHCVHELFEERALLHPETVAVVFEEQSLTYAELNGRANRLARYLQDLGVGPEVRVALCLERGVTMIVALLGVLKAGAAYVPLDPMYPAERLAYMLDDIQAPVVLTEQSLRERLPEGTSGVICLDTEEVRIGEYGTEDLGRTSSPENLAYVIYTSGSTGNPKGVMIKHRAVSNLACAQAEKFGIRSDSRVLQFAPFGFDASVSEWSTAFISGAVLVVPSPTQLLMGDDLVDLLNKKQITIVTLPPSVLMQLSPEAFLGPPTFVVAGEACPQDLVKRWATACFLLNAYGPTEGTVCASIFGPILEGQSPLIGRPIANIRIYVLDGYGHPVPVGVAGELHIGGAGVARGYLNRASLTAEKFVPDPYGEAGTRLYRTGDLARWNREGELEYLGRIDDQVKIRGFRIEPGEIESVLQQYAGVLQSAVIAREDVAGDKRLVGYVVWEDGAEASTAALRSYAQSRLPEYMVPSAVVSLASLPLTPNGKLDRRALPAPELDAELASRYVAPRDAVEEILAGLWEQVLGVERVGVEDNFFDLGGHSLLATQVVSRIRDLLQVEVPLRVLFESPTVRGIAAQLDQLRGSLLPALVRKERGEGPLPLSYAQQRLWFIAQLEPESAAYNSPGAVRLGGVLDAGALERSLREIVRRHEVLRTVFRMEDGSPVQEISSEVRLDLRRVDLSGLDEEEREEEARLIGREEARGAFDLSRGPLLRAVLLRLSEEDHVLLLTMHHVVSDGWSVGVLIRELGALYAAYQAGEESPLAELAVQYADFALWQREWLQGEVLEEQLRYWREQLSGVEALELPTDRPRPARQSYRGAFAHFTLSESLSSGLRSLSRRHGTTLYMTLLAAWAALLSRLSGQGDIVVGSPIANRRQSEIEGLIGFFVNTLALRLDLSGSPRVSALLQQVREQVLSAQQHQDIPFERVVELVEPVRSLSRSPVFQVMFAWESATESSLSLSGLEVEVLDVDLYSAKFDLTLSMHESGDRISGRLVYATDLFEPETIERYLEYLRMLLEGMAADRDAVVDQVPLLGVYEESQVLTDWNATSVPYPVDRCVHELFEEQSRLHPESAAVIFEDESVTYAELNARANRLARYLQELGVGPEVRVALCLERSATMIVALLGVLKAGAAYVPLDPMYPAERLAYMLNDIQAPVVLTEQSLRERLPEGTSGVICLDTEEVRIGEYGTEDLGRTSSPENLAYVIYTSGSTGNPKGVMINHFNVVRLFRSSQPLLSFNDSDTWSLCHSYAFDFSVWEIWGPLLHGGRLLVVPYYVVRSPKDLRELLERWEVSVFSQTPSALRSFVAEMITSQIEPPSTLKYIVLGGEALTEEGLGYWQDTKTELINMYGITETTVHVTFRNLSKESDLSVRNVGHQLADLKAYVLDGYGHPVPVGVAGELHIGGAGVARGYLNRASLTAEKFVPDPYGEAGTRLYRTGDLARWNREGELEYLGRIDDQVKIRGFRIEPGEIESVLQQYAGVLQSAVIAREDVAGDKRLVGYVVWEDGAEASTAALRSYAQSRLPEYMVPSAVVSLASLPLTPNGKLDRRALPAPELDAELASRYVAPRDAVEEILAGLWEQVLGVERVGVEDNFFDLGGHSLLATQVVSRIRDLLQVEVPLRVLFESPTVRGIAAQLDQLRGSLLPALVRKERGEGPLPLSYAQQRLWFIAQLEPESAAYNSPGAVRLGGVLDAGALERSLREIVRRHEVLRTVFRMEDGSPVQEISSEVRLDLRRVDLSGLDEEEREEEARLIGREEARGAFDLSRGPLLRAVLLRLSEEDHVLLLTMHHVVSDGWSVGVLIRELGALYAAYQAGEESPLAELAVQYADFALWQREWLQGEVLEEQLRYWREQLSGVEALELPTDRPRPLVPSRRSAHLPVALSLERTERLKALSQQEGVTLFMILLAGFQLVLSRYAGQGDVAVGTDVANRNRQEIEGLIGFFVNQLVMRTEVDRSRTFRDLLRQVRERALGAYAHQDLPFEKLVEELAPERDLGRAPLFQVKLVLQNTPQEHLQLAGLRLDRFSEGLGLIKVDLHLLLQEGAQGITGKLEYATELFDRETVESLLGHLYTVLDQMVASPDGLLSEVRLLGADEESQVLTEWNATTAEYETDRCVHELFEEQARLHPESVAVVFEEQSLTYTELNARANRLARYLQELGVGPEVRVALCLERSATMIVALLGVLKAGAAYVPLDPMYPAERLAYMLDDIQAPVVLTEQSLRERLPGHWAQVICLDTEWGPIEAQSGEDLGHTSDPENLAYVIYTSGSMGRPKGVGVEHRQIVNYSASIQDRMEIGHGTSLALISTFTADLGNTVLFPSLCGGGTLHLIGSDRLADGQRYAAYCREHRIDVLKITPTHLSGLLLGAGAAEVLPQRKLILGGEVSRWEWIRELQLSKPECEIFNHYGPTECTVGAVTYGGVSLEEEQGGIPLGRPLSNVRIYVLDGYGHPVPVGVAGELHIGGAGVARGYLNRASLTAEKFVPDPYGEAGTRLYRTGDLARWNREGELEYLGRIDDQVKIRGFRIEPGEIESVLQQYAGVLQSAVIAREDVAGDKRLVGYVVWEDGAEASTAALRSYAQSRLPEYMVPSAVVSLASLPLTPNGKLDRRALPAPELDAELASRYVAPRDAVEEILAGLWEQVLGVERVGVEDNFFDLGGHSLLATQVVSRIRDLLQVEVPLRVLFESPTVRGIAESMTLTESNKGQLKRVAEIVKKITEQTSI